LEDCLKLNLWVRNPLPPGGAPVIVWIHTGGFTAASANFNGTNGRRLADETGVIVVEANYRLGPFGFLAHGALEGEDAGRPSTGNYGLLDQRAALQWVRDNIAQFGGDPGNVTLGGTSAGGQSVGLHMVAPGSIGLFHHAIIESAYPTTRWRTRDVGVAQGDAFATALGCTVPADVLTCMRSRTREQVLAALPLANPQPVDQTTRAIWEPIVDGLEIPDQPRRLFEQGEFAHIPTIVGTNRDEGWGFVARSFPTGVSEAQYVGWVATEFGDDAESVLAMYPASDYPSATEAMSRLIGDGQFVCEARRLSDLIADGGLRGRGPHPEHDTGKREKAPVFMYSYDYLLNDLSLGHVIHGLETNIIFGNAYVQGVFAANHPLTTADLTLHAIMARYWALFAATGDPNGTEPVSWLEYRKNHNNYLVFDTTLEGRVDQRAEACAFWSEFNFGSMFWSTPAAAP
jgi:para-nitrobenzyl esterase